MSGMRNPGNFLSLLFILSEHDELLQRHLQAPRDQSAQYISTQIQNELLSVLSKMILNDILKEIQKAKFFAIMADEATSHNDEQLSLCLRFVDEGKNIREEFIEFVHMDKVSGHSIAILHSLDEKQLDATHIRSQTYDGAAAMSSENVGVQKRIREVSSWAMYSHCAGHCLNLVIVHSCKIPLVRNTIDKMKEVCLFFNYSPKREGLLKSVISKEVLHAEKRKPLLNLCAIRWAERHSAYIHLYASYLYMVYSLEVIAHALHQGKGYYQGNWASKTKQDASGLLASITSFDFILSFVTVYVMLSHLDDISKKLQSSSQDIFQAYEIVREVTQVYRKLRHDVVVHFGRCYAQAVRMAEKIGTTPDMPRITKRQIHRSNTPAATPEEYYRLNLAIPFLDHISNEFEQQFTGLSAKCGKLIGLVPTVLMSEDVEPDFEEVRNTYTDDLELFHHESFRWKLYLSVKFDDNLP
ncbi:52 kDa repressor of the inhibitor of the protein kinase-like [Acropora millepora]|uniref:52 kDa repressor of the inhibitor of the protein kinase-like n=1 Tax=Acropora millepora TaxID=45264 RepID=UPI001CF1EDF2|nr:52 kDa repressor of the inhibitor of the protein kinase-like [Acropora millepora]